MQPTILITIDVEDWFQVENFKPWIPFSTWEQRELRVEQNTHRLLDLFDSIELKPPSFPASQPEALDYELSAMPAPLNSLEKTAVRIQPGSYEKSHPKATFFILGWLAERLPHLVSEIQARGHEVASHGYNHELPNSLSPRDLKNDLIGSKKLLEDIIGEAVTGYRAPSFAINDDILQTIGDCGYQYDSSYNSFGLHSRYGTISLNGSGQQGIAHRINKNFHELPISNLQLSGITIPFGGGGYFRLMPYLPFIYGVRSILKKNNAYMFYIHSWEIDSEQPKVREAFTTVKFRHSVNLRNTQDKLINLIYAFSKCRFTTCSHYLFELKQTF